MFFASAKNIFTHSPENLEKGGEGSHTDVGCLAQAPVGEGNPYRIRDLKRAEKSGLSQRIKSLKMMKRSWEIPLFGVREAQIV